MNIGLAGFGTIGTGVYEIINVKGKSRFTENFSEPIHITKILDKDPNKKVHPDDHWAAIVTDPNALINDPDIHIIVCLCGGLTFEYELMKKALAAGKHVVTANKAVISEYFEELTEIAADHQVFLRYEAAVGGGIPVIAELKRQLRLNHIREIKGILNGTTNFILSKMTEEGADFDETLKLAQAIGFAEADPSADIDGNDVSRKLAILSSLAYGTIVKDEDIRKRSLSDVRALDIEFCSDLGYNIKYLGHSILNEDNTISTTVEPVLVPQGSMLANVNSEFNIVSLTGDVIGELQFYGKGAGKDATANAVVSDVIEIIKAISSEQKPQTEVFDQAFEKTGTLGFRGRYYFRAEIDSTDTLKLILNAISALDDRLNIILDKTHVFIITGHISAKDFDNMIEKVRLIQTNLFYARIYE